MATKATQIKRGNDILHPETDTSQVVGLADWAKQPNKPSYTAGEVGALPSATDYIKDAAVSQDGNTLTLTKKDNTQVTFAPSGSEKPMQLISTFAATAGKVVEIVPDISLYKKIIFNIQREQATTAGNNSTYVKIGTSSGGFYAGDTRRVCVFVTNYGSLAEVAISYSPSNNQTLMNVRHFYMEHRGGALTAAAGAAVFDGNETVTVYGQLK